MKRNPLIPFAVIAACGILLMVVVGLWGAHAAQEREAAKHKGAVATATPEKLFQDNCAACHGQNLEGGAGPNLQHIGGKLSKDAILKQINEGGGGMPGGLLQGDDAAKVAEWLAKKK
ncbi:cytochrome c550 [Tuberibacillus calidus]|jgi:mono/diheme cytochrome c family protein|uniref:cytochrome c550 n=1 Tax=Tuberibacillus calidus TaxID=340097 RepID=UPI000406F3B9|nr:cytochrome c [Tuberibacillus calidus]